MLNYAVYSLIIDTSTTTIVAAVARDGIVVASDVRDDMRAQRLLDSVDRVLKEAAVQREQVGQVVVGVGPGGFTGLRVGIATARGIASALGVPIVAVSSLRAIGVPIARTRPGTTVCARIDARRGEWFEALMTADAHGSVDTSCALRVVAADGDMCTPPRDASLVAYGAPTPEGLLYASAGRTGCLPNEVLPYYGREPDARPGAWVQSGTRS